MSQIIVSESEWSTIKMEMLLTRSGFDYSVFQLLDNQLIKSNASITFPKTLTKQERWRIHTFSEKNMVVSRSEDTPRQGVVGPQSDRILTTELSKEYIKHIRGVYQCTITEPTVPIVQIEAFEKFKKAILDDIMTLVDKHLNAEFLKFYI